MDKIYQLSIIVPVYNVEEWLERCLDSILAQTWKDFELICVDDGSTDSSLNILHKYQKIDDRIKIIHKENGGLVSARKAGIIAAAGEYISYVDSDDWIEENMCQCMMEKAIETDADIITSGVKLEYQDGIITELGEVKEGIYAGEKLKTAFWTNMINTDEFFMQGVSMHIFAKIYKKEHIYKYQNNVPNHIVVGEDAACVYPGLLHAEKVFVLNKAFYHYQMRSNSIMGENNVDIGNYKSLFRHLRPYFHQASYDKAMEQLDQLIVFLILLRAPDIFWKKDRLIPYENLKRGKIVLYGMGRFGKAFRNVIERRDGYEILALVDKNRMTDATGEKCCSLKEFTEQKFDYDYIVITILKYNICQMAVKDLTECGIPLEKIKRPDGRYITESMISLRNEKIL